MVATITGTSEVTLEASLPTEVEFRAADVQRVRAMLETAKAAVKEVDALFIAAAKAAKVDTVILADGTRVTVTDADRRKIDSDTLAGIVPASTFDTVTKTAVDHKKFDAAVEVGLIDPKVVKSAITLTPYTAIKITKK